MTHPRPGNPMPTTRRLTRPTALLLAAVVAAACAEPALPDNADGGGAAQPLEAATPDPGRDELVTQLTDLRARIADARDDLAAVGEAPDAAAARRLAEDVVSQLAAAPGDAAGEGSSLFPTTTTDRGSSDGDDLLTRTLTAARDAGGQLGRGALELLRDPIGGDLGSWQRDPAGVVRTVEATADPSTPLEQLEADVLELPGEGTRALAWALLAAGTRDLQDAQAYAERGVAHLDLIVQALDDLLAEEGPT
jgi:hypothetical protein